jgi:hypothetical protein
LCLHHVGEIGSVEELDGDGLRRVDEALEHDVLVRALRDEAVPAHRDGRRVVVVRGALRDDPRREVVDASARQRLELVAVQPDEPPRQMTDVAEEVPLRPFRLDVAVRV